MAKTKRSLKPVFAILAASAVVATGYTLIINRQTPQPVQVAEITSSGSVSLSLSPATLTMAPNTESTVSLVANSGSDKLSLVKFELNFDPAKVQVSNLNVGNWITKGLPNPTIGTGKISGILGAQPDPDIDNGGPEFNRTGTGTLLTFKVKPLGYGTIPISFNNSYSQALTTSNTTNSPNMLKATNNLTITVKLLSDIAGSDRRVDIYDYNAFLLQFGKPGTGDFNNSGLVDIYDYSTLVADYGKTW